MSANDQKRDWEIPSRISRISSRMEVLWQYRHLLVGLVRRDFLLNYQQTVLGPFRIYFHPIMALVTYVVVLDKLVGIPTGNVASVLFYLAGIVLWNLFSDEFMGTSATYRDNALDFSNA